MQFAKSAGIGVIIANRSTQMACSVNSLAKTADVQIIEKATGIITRSVKSNSILPDCVVAD